MARKKPWSSSGGSSLELRPGKKPSRKYSAPKKFKKRPYSGDVTKKWKKDDNGAGGTNY